MAKKNRRVEDKELNDLNKSDYMSDSLSVNDKVLINKFIPNDLRITAKNESQIRLINSIKKNEVTICAGSPGSGKTFVTMGMALGLLRKSENTYKKIYMVKSVTALKGEELGFLKGDLKDKIEPFMWSFSLNMEKLISEQSLKTLVEKEVIRPFPLAYIRGVTLDDCIICCDEAQNISVDNMKTLMTRIGSNCKLIILGDMNQVDLKSKKDSSLHKLVEMFTDVEKIGVVVMSADDDNVRNPLIKIIEEKFKHYEK